MFLYSFKSNLKLLYCLVNDDGPGNTYMCSYFVCSSSISVITSFGDDCEVEKETPCFCFSVIVC